MGSVVRAVPLTEAEMRTAHVLLERLASELREAELRALSAAGLRRRRVFLFRDVTGPWVVDAIEGDPALIQLGPEAVWSLSACSLDRWILVREPRGLVGDLGSLPDVVPALDLRLTAEDAWTEPTAASSRSPAEAGR